MVSSLQGQMILAKCCNQPGNLNVFMLANKNTNVILQFQSLLW